MSADRSRLERVEQIFHEICDLPVSAREQQAYSLANGDAELAGEALALCGADERNRHPIATAAPEFGPYRVVREIGAGGMGAVYLAERVDGTFEQRVAIKTALSRLSGYLVERFLEERQILAGLSHPNIARLLDGGITAEGIPYLAMEYIDGPRIDEHCDRGSLGERGRLSLFLRICDAVHYLHRNLITHRDLKPGNVLVDAEGVVKLIDFGTAKLFRPMEEGAAGETRTVSRSFTPDFASPEQVLGKPVTTASDIYSLGVFLCHLVARQPPYRFERYTTEELIEVVCQREPQIQGLGPDLSAIAAKCLRKEPEARYGSVEELKRDIEAFLAGLPVAARAGNLAYRARKFVARNRYRAAGAAVVALSLFGGLAATLWQASIAQQRYRDLRTLTGTMLFDLNRAIQEIPGATASQRLLVTRILPVIDRMAASAAGDPTVRLDLVEAYRQFGNLLGNPYAQNLGDPKAALDTLRKARAISSKEAAAQNAPPEWLRIHAMVDRGIAETCFATGDSSAALPAIRVAAATADRLVRASPTAADLAEAASIHGVLGDILGQPGSASLRDPRAAVTSYEAALDLSRRALRTEPGLARSQRAMAIHQWKIGDVLSVAEPERALEYYQRAAAAVSSTPTLAADQRIAAMLGRMIGESYLAMSRPADALPQFEKALEINRRLAAADRENTRARFDLATSENGLATLRWQTGDWAAAIPHLEAMISGLEPQLMRDEQDSMIATYYADALCRLAEARYRTGNPELARTLWQKGAKALQALADSPDAPTETLELATLRFATTLPESHRNSERALRYAGRRQEITGAADPEALLILALAQRATGDLEAARKSAARGLEYLPPATSTLRAQLTEIAGAGK